MKRKASAADKRRFDALADIGCELCDFLNIGNTPPQIHHVRARHGWGRTSHQHTIGLCHYHHVDPRNGVHAMGRYQFTSMYGISELDLLARANQRLGIKDAA